MGKVRARASSRDRANRRGARQAHLEGPDVLDRRGTLSKGGRKICQPMSETQPES